MVLPTEIDSTPQTDATGQEIDDIEKNQSDTDPQQRDRKADTQVDTKKPAIKSNADFKENKMSHTMNSEWCVLCESHEVSLSLLSP